MEAPQCRLPAAFRCLAIPVQALLSAVSRGHVSTRQSSIVSNGFAAIGPYTTVLRKRILHTHHQARNMSKVLTDKCRVCGSDSRFAFAQLVLGRTVNYFD